MLISNLSMIQNDLKDIRKQLINAVRKLMDCIILI